MPCKNIVKIYVKDGYYHLYNRGVEKRTIFEDEHDYKVFLNNLKSYLSPPPDISNTKTYFSLKGGTFQGIPHQLKNYSDKIELLAYCLMPNHFHFLLKQNDKDAMENFTRSLFTKYSIYFNKKYDRVGKLFQGHYKAVIVLDDPYLLHLSRYIHQNPSEYTNNLTEAYSSYADYLGLRKTPWVKPEFILKFFDQAKKDFDQGTNTYKDFVEKYKKDSAEVLGRMVLE